VKPEKLNRTELKPKKTEPNRKKTEPKQTKSELINLNQFRFGFIFKKKQLI
jgi:hypothetical protein